MTEYKHWSVLSLMTLALIACGGGTSNQDGAGGPTAGLEGRVTINGGLAGATIFVDLNDSQSLDEDEPVGYTDSQGFFGYNPITRVNYCKSESLALRKHCLRLPSLDNLPDEVTLFYMGGIKLASGEQNDKVYRYHVQVDQLRGRDLDLDAAKALISAVADSDEGEDILYAIIDAFYQKHMPQPRFVAGRSATPFVLPGLSTQEKFEALMAAGVFAGLDSNTDLDASLDRAAFTRLMGGILDMGNTPPPASTFFDVSGAEWAAGYIAEMSAAILHTGQGHTFTPGSGVSGEQMALIVARSLGLEPAEPVGHAGVADWAKTYIQLTAQHGLLAPVVDYTAAQARERLLQAAFLAKENLSDEPDDRLFVALQQLGLQLQTDQALNDSFDEVEFDQLLDGLPALLQAGVTSNRYLNQAGFQDFLLNPGRNWIDWLNQDYSALLLGKTFFDAAVEALQARVIDIGFSDLAKGQGRLQLLLTPGGQQAFAGGRVQACIVYEDYNVPADEQLFRQAMYVAGDWARVNDSALVLNLNVMPGYAYGRVLQLDWRQITPDIGDMSTIGFDLGDAMNAWHFSLLPEVDYRWQSMDAHQAAANATCDIFLG